MSLLQKLTELKEEKTVQKKAIETSQKLQTLSEISGKLDDLTNRHSRIIQLMINLGEARENASNSLEDYKSQKETLKNIYEDGKDIWNEQGINSLEELMTENAAEPELIKFRESGRRGPLTQEDPSGETGKLYSDTAQLRDTEEELLKLLPENLKKLSFSSVKSKENGLSKREESLNLINGYLETLNSEIEDLKKEKEALYTETPEGKRAAILKCQRPDFYGVRLDNPAYFSIPKKLIELSRQVSADSVKEFCSEQLGEHLTKVAWTKIDPKDQKAVNNHSELAKLEELHEIKTDFDSAEQARQKALNHLEGIFSQPVISQKIHSYGIHGGIKSENDDEFQKYKGWSSARILADRYLSHMQDLTRDHSSFDSYRGPYSQLVVLFKENLNRNQGRNSLEKIDNPEHIKTSFNNFQKFYEFIASQTNEQTDFVGGIGSQGEVQKKLNDPESRKNIGFIEGEDSPERFLKVPTSFIQENGGLSQAIANSESKNNEWEKRKESIKKISKAAVDLRWAQEYNLNFKNNNKQTLDEINNIKELATNLKLAAASEPYLPVAKFATRKVKIESDGSLSDLTDLTANEDYETYQKELDAVKKEAADYSNRRMAELNKEIITLQKKILIWNKEEQIAPLSHRYGFFKEYEQGQYAVNFDRISKILSPDELAQIKYIEGKKNECKNKYNATEKIRLDFLNSFKRPSFILKIDKEDSLSERTLTVENLFSSIKDRQIEAETILNNLPDDKKAIWEENKHSIEEVKNANEKYTQTIRENVLATR